eukprot:TRINITY_DN3688_c0_g1_i4.p1 TRINITY_DN3688_c0_g1~~TRINITY_DN3688_c0_g1_i4.p1  ORF type:complete len:350 (-),score=42.68 TRINITY_DN3688_c0_g1_i4:175-1224(-)
MCIRDSYISFQKRRGPKSQESSPFRTRPIFSHLVTTQVESDRNQNNTQLKHSSPSMLKTHQLIPEDTKTVELYATLMCKSKNFQSMITTLKKETRVCLKLRLVLFMMNIVVSSIDQEKVVSSDADMKTFEDNLRKRARIINLINHISGKRERLVDQALLAFVDLLEGFSILGRLSNPRILYLERKINSMLSSLKDCLHSQNIINSSPFSDRTLETVNMSLKNFAMDIFQQRKLIEEKQASLISSPRSTTSTKSTTSSKSAKMDLSQEEKTLNPIRKRARLLQLQYDEFLSWLHTRKKKNREKWRLCSFHVHYQFFRWFLAFCDQLEFHFCFSQFCFVHKTNMAHCHPYM